MKDSWFLYLLYKWGLHINWDYSINSDAWLNLLVFEIIIPWSETAGNTKSMQRSIYSVAENKCLKTTKISYAYPVCWFSFCF